MTKRGGARAESELSKRERVEAAMRLQQTDRVPVYDIILNDAIIEYFTGRTAPVGEEGLRLKCETIRRMLDMTRMVEYGPFERRETTSPDGFVHLQERWTLGGIVKRPFREEKGAARWLAAGNRQMAQAYARLDLKKHAEEFRANFARIQGYIRDDTVVLHGETGTGLDQLRYLLGIELFTYVYADEPDLIREYLDLWTERQVAVIHATADRRLSPCALTYGDIAFKGSLLHSPEWLRREFFPRLKRLNDAWHDHDVSCLFHSDGYYMDVIPDIMEAGADGINPIESVAGMDLERVKQAYGAELYIAGSIDISQLMSLGTPAQVRKVCLHDIEIGRPGYFIGSTTELDNGARLENILAMLEAAWGVELPSEGNTDP